MHADEGTATAGAARSLVVDDLQARLADHLRNLCQRQDMEGIVATLARLEETGHG